MFIPVPTAAPSAADASKPSTQTLDHPPAADEANRQDPPATRPQQLPKAPAALGIPGMATRRDAPKSALPGISSRQGLALPGQREKSANYVTETATTPICPKAPPGFLQERVPIPLHSSGHLLPKWARSSLSIEQGSMQSSVISSHCDVDSESLQMPPRDSKASFWWAPERVSVPSWHQKLSETYMGYNMVNTIGEGRHGAVFIVQHRLSEKYYACKVLHKSDHEPNALRGEIKTLRSLDHPNIVRLYETNEDERDVFLLMELCHGGDLFDRITEEGQLPEHVARAFAEQMFKALAYCHSKGVVHHDVKPENFLLETEDPSCLMLKLADFGIATSMRPSKLATIGARDTEVKGSIPYMAPERFLRKSHLEKESKQDLAAEDLWSCGIVVYFMLSGSLPYGEDIDAICSGQPPDFSREVWKTVSEEAVDLILVLLNPDVTTRWTAVQALYHPWLSSKRESHVPTESGVTESAPGIGTPIDRHVIARTLVRSLRLWRHSAKLRRVAIAAIAKRLEADHPSLRLAQAAYHAFNTKHGKLRCEDFVHALNDALCEAMVNPATASLSSQDEARQTLGPANATLSSSGDSSNTMTGLHVRRTMKGMMGRLRKLAEDTPLSSSPMDKPAEIAPVGSEDLVSLTELKCLVEALDGVKNGKVDFTLLVATLLPPAVLCDEARTLEAFSMFDFRKRGGINGEDLLTYMKPAVSSRDVSIASFSDMIAEFDQNGDGVLDLVEFRAMLRGGMAMIRRDTHSPSDLAASGASP